MNQWIELYSKEWKLLEHQCKSQPEKAKTSRQARESFELLMELWKFLQTKSEKERYLSVLPGFHTADIECDAVMITAGGIYLYHLLPLSAAQFKLEGSRLVAAEHSEQQWTHDMARAKQVMTALVEQLGYHSIPIYGIYIAPRTISGRYVFGDSLLLNLDELAIYFQNLVFRQKQNFTELVTFIEKHSYLNQKYLPPNTPKIVNAHVEPTPKRVEEQQVLEEWKAAEAQAAPSMAVEKTDPTQAIPNVLIPKELPPRRRETKKKQSGWWTKIFGNNK